jgi:hypothetical protein
VRGDRINVMDDATVKGRGWPGEVCAQYESRYEVLRNSE